MTAPVLVDARARLVRLPLRRPWAADVTTVDVIVVTAVDSAGVVGEGLTWTPTIGGRAVLSLLEDHVRPFALGRAADPSGWDAAWERLHEGGGGGLTTIALAGLDLALWDLVARRRGTGLAETIGRRHSRLPVYGSGVNLHYSIDELVAQARRWVDAGYRRVKVKVGKPDLAEDLDRLAAVRETIGPDRELAIDANQRWGLERAIESAQALAAAAPIWLEEPLRADDLPGYVALRRESPVPIAAGENIHTRYRFREFIDAEALDVVQPNVVRVGGITPFLRIAELAADAGVAIAPHLLPELSAQVAFTLPEPSWVEVVEDAGFAESGALAEPTGLRFAEGWVSGGPALGLGLRFLPEQERP